MTLGASTTKPCAAIRSAIRSICGRRPNASGISRTPGWPPPSSGRARYASATPSGIVISIVSPLIAQLLAFVPGRGSLARPPCSGRARSTALRRQRDVRLGAVHEGLRGAAADAERRRHLVVAAIVELAQDERQP